MENQENTENKQAPNWEREVLEKLVLATLAEQRQTRRWGIFFKTLLFVYLLAIFGVAIYPQIKTDIKSVNENHTAVIDVVGMIAENQPTNAASIIESLRDAVKDQHTKGIILHANSPGGSAVQSAYVYEEIRNIKKNHPKLPIYGVIGDMCASGCYYILAASDKIFLNPASLVGSIGVVMDGFGFVDAMEKVGVERRLLTAGAHKALLDPFSPPKEDETQYMKGLLAEVHQQFINAVKTGRGERLQETPEMFSGLVWSGETAIKLGIADAVGNDGSVAKDIIGAEKLVDFTQQEQLLERLAGKFGAAFGQTFSSLLNTPNLR